MRNIEHDPQAVGLRNDRFPELADAAMKGVVGGGVAEMIVLEMTEAHIAYPQAVEGPHQVEPSFENGRAVLHAHHHRDLAGALGCRHIRRGPGKRQLPRIIFNPTADHITERQGVNKRVLTLQRGRGIDNHERSVHARGAHSREIDEGLLAFFMQSPIRKIERSRGRIEMGIENRELLVQLTGPVKDVILAHRNC